MFDREYKSGSILVEYDMTSAYHRSHEGTLNSPSSFVWQRTLSKNRSKDETAEALDTTIENYNDENGFVDLPDQLQVFVHRSLVLEVCPSVLRKCFTEALISALVGVLGSTTMGNGVKQTWSKIGRVLEQVIAKHGTSTQYVKRSKQANIGRTAEITLFESRTSAAMVVKKRRTISQKIFTTRVETVLGQIN
ncbi:unnamed protein product [Toxocara canis]|uniref:DNA-directed RNA polymerase n=1 Tax=Toxocara canis TaxID=6265 RepID=A0A183USP5_TOXCA|nr:unnamed protein product [Toxocara canis]